MIDRQIKDWLKSNGKDRYWLAEQLGVSKGSVDNWLSAGRAIPVVAQKLIKIMMNGGDVPSLKDPFHVIFTAAEFEDIEDARKILKMSREQFYREAVTKLAEKVISECKIKFRHREHFAADPNAPLEKEA